MFQEEESRYGGNVLIQHARVQPEQVGKPQDEAIEASQKRQLLAVPQAGSSASS